MTDWESVQDWINRQGWPEEVEVEALLAVQWRDDRDLNPITLGEWRKWAAARGLGVS